MRALRRLQGNNWSNRRLKWVALRLRVLHTPTRRGRGQQMGCIAPASFTRTHRPVNEGGPDNFLKKRERRWLFPNPPTLTDHCRFRSCPLDSLVDLVIRTRLIPG